MWKVDGDKLYMSEGDFGLGLPFTVSGFEVAPTDSLRFTFKTATNGDTILEKTYTNIVDNSFELTFTADESELFTPGTYVYSLEWYQSGHFACFIVENGRFKVGDVA